MEQSPAPTKPSNVLPGQNKQPETKAWPLTDAEKKTQGDKPKPEGGSATDKEQSQGSCSTKS